MCDVYYVDCCTPSQVATVMVLNCTWNVGLVTKNIHYVFENYKSTMKYFWVSQGGDSIKKNVSCAPEKKDTSFTSEIRPGTIKACEKGAIPKAWRVSCSFESEIKHAKKC